MKGSYIYILTNRQRTVFYTGVTGNFVRRMQAHILGKGSVFCRKYNVNILVYYELFIDIQSAIKREKQIKGWKREWKIALIKTRNPDLKNLFHIK
ncbi:MAG: GIY-YIG nuclease family protein [Bacteroidales bacterium]|nr:GIY-YIG nuclease family protein [Bacteroidales bacterium]